MADRKSALVAFALLALALGAGAAIELRSAGLTPADAVLWRLLALQLGWAGIATAAAVALGGGVRERLGLRRIELPGPALLAGVFGTLALSAALHFVLVTVDLRGGGALGRIDALVAAAQPESPWLALLAVGLAPALGEELLFRGLLQRSLAARFGPAAIALAGAAFGLLHQDLVHTPAAFVLGCYLGAVAYLARSTWAAVLCHGANNAAATVQQGLGVGIPVPAGGEGALWACGGVTAAGLCLGFVLWRARRGPTA